MYDNSAVEPHTSRGLGQQLNGIPPLYCTITLIAMEGHLHWVVVHNLIGYSTVQYRSDNIREYLHVGTSCQGSMG